MKALPHMCKHQRSKGFPPTYSPLLTRGCFSDVGDGDSPRGQILTGGSGISVAKHAVDDILADDFFAFLVVHLQGVVVVVDSAAIDKVHFVRDRFEDAFEEAKENV